MYSQDIIKRRFQTSKERRQKQVRDVTAEGEKDSKTSGQYFRKYK